MVTLRTVAAEAQAARRPASEARALSARLWLAACPWLESHYESQEAWHLAQTAAFPFRAPGRAPGPA